MVIVRSGFRALVTATVVLVATASCSRRSEGPAENGPAAAGPPATYVMKASEIKVEYLPLDIPTSMKAGAEVTVRFQVKNLSGDSWLAKGAGAVRFGYHWCDPVRTGGWSSVVWDDGFRGALTSDLAPGARAVVTLTVRALRAPAKDAKLVVAPVMDGPPGGWQQDAPLVATVNVE